MKKIMFILLITLSGKINFGQQVLHLDAIIDSVQQSHPSLKMYDAEGQSMDAAAKGAWSWMPPEAGTGFFMMPYNPKYTRKTDMGEGMGQYAIAVQPDIRTKQTTARWSVSVRAVVRQRRGLVCGSG